MGGAPDRVEEVRRGFCRSSGGTTSALHLCGLGAVSGTRLALSEQMESQDDDDRRLSEFRESTEDCDDRSDHMEADDAAVDCDEDRREPWGIGCQVVGLEGDTLLMAPHILKGGLYVEDRPGA